MLFHDHFFGHRDYYTGEEECAASDVSWTPWDYALADAMQFIQDHTNQHGHLVWEYESEDVEVIVNKKIDRHDAIVTRKTKGGKNKPYNPTPGEYFVSRLELMPWVKEWPTVGDWYRSQETASDG